MVIICWFEKRDSVLFLFLGRPAIIQPRFTDVRINHTRFLVTWDYPDDNGGAEVIMFTVWYRAVRPINDTMVGKWTTMNVTHNSCLLKLNCCSTYELMVTAWNRNGPSFTDPDNAARITVIGGIHVFHSHSYRRVIWSIFKTISKGFEVWNWEFLLVQNKKDGDICRLAQWI